MVKEKKNEETKYIKRNHVDVGGCGRYIFFSWICNVELIKINKIVKMHHVRKKLFYNQKLTVSEERILHVLPQRDPRIC